MYAMLRKAYFSYRQALENDAERLPALPTELHIHYASLISGIINSFSEGHRQQKLFCREVRYSLLFMLSSWSGHFWPPQPQENTDEDQQRYSSIGHI